MIHEADLRELAEFDGEGNRVLSLYLDVDPRHTTSEIYKLALRNLFDSVPEVDPADQARVEQYIELEYDRQARGIVCFSCQKKDFWRVFPLDVPVENAIMVSRRPLVRRLVDLFNVYGNLGVAAIDKRGARFFAFHMGSLEEAIGALGEDVKRHKQGGWSASRFQRHEDEAAKGNLKKFVELTEKFARQYTWNKLILGGVHSTLVQFQEMLPHHLKKMIIGTMSLELDANPQEIRERAEALAKEAYEHYTQNLASELITQAKKGNQAVLGLEATLEALQSGRVYQLLFTGRLQLPENAVRRCTQCNYLSTAPDDACPLCGGEMKPLTDAVNTIARRAIAQGASVIVLPDDNPLEAADEHIGAILRY